MKSDPTEVGKKIGEFLLSLAKESERAAVIFGAAKLDSTLELLLKRSLQFPHGGRDDLFDPERALSTFSSKIAIAYRLGLIDRDFEYSLQCIRKIRNNFAHSIDSESLSKKGHHDRLCEMAKRASSVQLFLIVSDSICKLPGVTKDLATFCGVLAVLLAKIEFAIHSATEPKPMFVASF